MKLKLRRIAPFQAGKLLGAFYGLMSLIFVPFMLIFTVLGSFAAKTQGPAAAPAMPMIWGMGVGFMLFLPVLYAGMGFIAGVLSAVIYNWLGGWLGGLELDFDPVSPTPPPGAAPAVPPGA